MARWDDTCEGILDQLWEVLETGVAKADAPARRPVLASLSADGGPEARIVVLRKAARDAARLALYTDAWSVKVAEFARDPRAALHVWEPDLALQIRLRGRVEMISGAATADIWAETPEVSRGNYGVVPAPGTPIEARDAFTRVPDPARLVVLSVDLDHLDAVVLAPDIHRRARYTRADGWRGIWLAP